MPASPPTATVRFVLSARCSSRRNDDGDANEEVLVLLGAVAFGGGLGCLWRRTARQGRQQRGSTRGPPSASAPAGYASSAKSSRAPAADYAAPSPPPALNPQPSRARKRLPPANVPVSAPSGARHATRTSRIPRSIAPTTTTPRSSSASTTTIAKARARWRTTPTTARWATQWSTCRRWASRSPQRRLGQTASGILRRRPHLRDRRSWSALHHHRQQRQRHSRRSGRFGRRARRARRQVRRLRQARLPRSALGQRGDRRLSTDERQRSCFPLRLGPRLVRGPHWHRPQCGSHRGGLLRARAAPPRGPGPAMRSIVARPPTPSPANTPRHPPEVVTWRRCAFSTSVTWLASRPPP